MMKRTMRQDRTGTTKSVLFVLACAAVLLVAAAGTQAVAQETDECLECHQDRNLTKKDATGRVHSLYVDKDGFARSVHGEMDYTCVDCHEGARAEEHPAEGLPDVKCGECHEEALAAFTASNHGRLLAAGNPDAPQCYDCHGMHDVLSSDTPAAATSPERLSETCGACHEAQAYNPLRPNAAARVKGHGKVNMSADFSTENCGACHFEVIRHGDEDREPAVCAGCHEVEKSTLLFGTIHRPKLVTGSLLHAGLLLMYLVVCIAGLTVYLRKGPAGKPSEGQGEEQS